MGEVDLDDEVGDSTRVGRVLPDADDNLDDDVDDDSVERVLDVAGSDVADLLALFLGGGISPSSAPSPLPINLSLSVPLSLLSPSSLESALPFPSDSFAWRSPLDDDDLGKATPAPCGAAEQLEDDADDDDRFLRWLLPLDDNALRVGIIEHLRRACGRERARGDFSGEVAAIGFPSVEPIPLPISTLPSSCTT